MTGPVRFSLQDTKNNANPVSRFERKKQKWDPDPNRHEQKQDISPVEIRLPTSVCVLCHGSCFLSLFQQEESRSRISRVTLIVVVTV